MRPLVVSLAAVASAVWLAGAPQLAHARPGDARIRQLRVDVAAVLDRERVPGAGIALVDRAGTVWAGGVGHADLDTGRPVDAHTLFRVASITKSFVALAVARLHERGVLDLDQRVTELLPDVELTNRWRADAPITLAHLLEHTAGFDDMRFNELGGPGAETTPLLEVLARNPRSRVARWRPGTRFAYANPGYTVAAAAIERVTGRDYRAMVRELVLDPLGIRDAHFARTDGVDERLARGYARPGVATPYLSIYHHPAGALMTSPTELALLVHHWLVRSDAVVGPAMLARIERGETLPYAPTDETYGLGNYGDVRHGAACRGHDGGLPGFLSTYRYCPGLGVGYVVLTNATHSAVAHGAIDRLVFEAMTEAIDVPPAPTAPPDSVERRRVAGYYAFASPRSELFGFIERLLVGVEIADVDGALVARPLLGGSARLVRTGPGGYRLAHEGGTSLRFARDRDGNDVLIVGSGGYFERGSARTARVKLWLATSSMRVMWALPAVFVGLLLLWVVTGTRPLELGLLVCPTLSAVALAGAIALVGTVDLGSLATRTPTAVALCALTIAHAVFAAAGAALCGRALIARGRAPGWLMRGCATAASTACVGFAAWLALNGIIGLRTWAW